MSLVTIQTAIYKELVLEYPLARNNVSAGRVWDKVPCAILQQGGELILHSSPPIGISETIAECLRNGRELGYQEPRIDGVRGHPKPALGPSLDGVLIHHRG